MRDTLRIKEVKKVQTLANILTKQAGFQVNYKGLSKTIHVSDQTIRTWIKHLEFFYYCFTLKPWAKNVVRSLVKEPIVYLWDWSSVSNKWMKYQNMIASHLLKAVHFWTDEGFGQFDLWYLRDQQKNEVDFLVTKDNQPWMMVDVKSSPKEPLSKSLYHFQKQLKAPHCFQVAMEGDYLDYNCFDQKNLYKPTKVPAKTFLSQLV
jgi:predicted AAA+ superfamily ATPase